MLPTDPDQLSPAEREALDGLPREREPSRMLEERTVRALRDEGLFQPVRGINPHAPFGWLAAGIAAALVLFASGVVVGQWMGARSTVQAIVAVEEANAREVAALVQQTGSQYAAALAALTQVPSSAADSNWVAQGREVALTALYTVADQMVQVAPDDPLVARILQALEGDRRSSEEGSGTPVRQVVWF
jgi:hypothetical protein